MNFVVGGEIIYVLMALYNGNNFVEATMTLSYIGFVVVGQFKIIYSWWQKDEMTQFVDELCEMFPNTHSQQQQYNLRDYLRKCTAITLGFSLMYMFLIWTYNLFAMAQYMIYDRWLEVQQLGQSLPYYMYIPWNWHDHWTYYMLYASQSLAGYTSAAGTISSDLMLCATATQIIMHYDFVSKTIESYEANAICNADRGRMADMAFLREMVAYHERVLCLSKTMNNLFGVPLLVNFMTSSFVICFVGFQMTIGVATDALIKLSLFFFSSMAQVYMICYYGQQLLDASGNIARAAYHQDWHNANVDYKKMLVLIAERAQKPALLKATRFMSISRGTMTEMLQISYKFFALLRTMYSK